MNEEAVPTLVEFSLGDGWVILSGQPLEHQYDRVYGSPDMEELLPRIVEYFTGKPIITAERVVLGASADRPSCENEPER